MHPLNKNKMKTLPKFLEHKHDLPFFLIFFIQFSLWSPFSGHQGYFSKQILSAARKKKSMPAVQNSWATMQ